MDIYVTGGYVRDTLLGLDPKDMDFVVVGATQSQLEDFGYKNRLWFKQVGADFPVFLDKYGREWALARKERKVGPGYKGFECSFDPDVTLEEDLFRRDLTINAMALRVIEITETSQTIEQTLIDPYHGRYDLNNYKLRHVSDHFVEDPVRVLRIARFVARYNFSIDPGTILLINEMVRNGELDSLVPERVWAEFEKVLSESKPSRFLIALKDTKVFDHLFPQLEGIFHYPIQKAFDKALLPDEKIAILVSNMSTTEAADLLNWFVPKKYHNLALNYNKLIKILENVNHHINSNDVENIFETVQSYRNKDFFQKALCVDAYFGTDTPYFDNISLLCEIFDETIRIGYDDLDLTQQSQLVGPEIGDAIQELRRNKIKQFLEEEPYR